MTEKMFDHLGDFVRSVVVVFSLAHLSGNIFWASDKNRRAAGLHFSGMALISGLTNIATAE
jgi:hypothetical protein